MSQRGSYLSHLSILAREPKLLVVVGVDLSKLGFNIGDKLEIGGEEILRLLL